jgi:hypothetical protein
LANDSKLTWTTTEETNTSHFEIERSADGKVFTKAGSVTASFNSSGRKNYSYTDANVTALSTPILYYRIKMVGADGQFTYSSIVSIRIIANAGPLAVYPKPATDNLSLMVSLKQKEQLNLQIFNNAGTLVQTKAISLKEGSNIISIGVSNLPSGAYTLQVKGSATINQATRFIKQ